VAVIALLNIDTLEANIKMFFAGTGYVVPEINCFGVRREGISERCEFVLVLVN